MTKYKIVNNKRIEMTEEEIAEYEAAKAELDAMVDIDTAEETE